MKTFLKIAGGVVGVIVVALVAVFYFTAGMTDTADRFFEAVKSQDWAGTQSYLSEEFKASTGEAALQEFLEGDALEDFREASWSSREISGGKGELEGVVTGETGGTVPVKLTMVKEGGEWKIYHIQRTALAGVADTPAAEIPGPDEQIAMVQQALRDFTISVENRSMEHFRSTVSQFWQDQVTAAELDEIFGETYDANLDFASLDNITPILEPVTGLGEHGELVLRCYYPTTPDQLHLQQKFVFEDDRWKLMGFSFTIE